MRKIAIIGAGFSGTMVAVHLLNNADDAAPVEIHLIERSGRFTAGVAYSTPFGCHLLNVPAGRMSAFENDQDHFLKWARSRDGSIGGGTFVPRKLYGHYLADVLNDAEQRALGAGSRLLRIAGEATSLTIGDSNTTAITVANHGLIVADAVVLGIGNFPPSDPPVADRGFYESQHYARDPWSCDALDISPDQSVLLLGTGLTMLDIALALHERNHRGTIYALSRRGLLPQPHRHSAKPPLSHERPSDLQSWPRSVRGLLNRIRNEVANAGKIGVDWREVVTSLRADTPALWQSLSEAEQSRFLRHVRPFWETHRHRAAPQIAAQIQSMIDSRQLQIVPGRVVGYRTEPERVEVTLRRRGQMKGETLFVCKVVNCTGPDTDLNRVEDRLIQSLREGGLIRPERLGLGVETDQSGAAIQANGEINNRLFVVGPLRKGQLWENTAVPELRVEAEKLAQRLAKFTRKS